MAKKVISRQRRIADAMFIAIIVFCIVLILVYQIQGAWHVIDGTKATSSPGPAATAIP
jgi:flagellar basal body-associated protein FliL